MRAYVIRRVLLLIPTFFLLTILVFLSVRFIPGDIIDVLVWRMEETMGGTIDIDSAELERRLGLDVPVHVQYAAGWAASCCVAISARLCCGRNRLETDRRSDCRPPSSWAWWR